ncbi:MAG: SpoIIE family protein phosphatase [Bacteroidales bacterium]|nr:SpoIIE family protein phosphatase [Bacteroidales bacterium]
MIVLISFVFIVKGFVLYLFRRKSEIFEKELKEQNEKSKSLTLKVQALNLEIENLRKQLNSSNESLNSLQKEYNNVVCFTRNYFDFMYDYNEQLKKYFGDNYFLVSYPKSDIGDDIIFIQKVNDYIIIAIIDSSGSGIQLFLNNLIIIDILKSATIKEKLNKPSEILRYVNNTILEKYNFNKFPYLLTYSIGIVSILYKHNIVEYAGARNLLLYRYKDSIITQKGDNYLINNFSDKLRDFKNFGIPIHDNSILYLFTDGISNQIVNNKKIKRKFLIELINNCRKSTIREQYNLISREIENLIMKENQIDDIKILGIKLYDNN